MPDLTGRPGRAVTQTCAQHFILRHAPALHPDLSVDGWAVGRGGSARKWPRALCCVHLGDPTGSWRCPFLCTPWLGGFFFSLNLLFSFLCGLRVPRELQSSFNRNNTQSFILGYPEFCPSAAPPPNLSFDPVLLLFSYIPFCFYVSQPLRCEFSLCYSLSCILCSLFVTLLQQVQRFSLQFCCHFLRVKGTELKGYLNLLWRKVSSNLSPLLWKG